MNDSVRKPAQSTQDADNGDARLCLSALADGEADALPQACRAWRDDAKARQTWHAYHLIGDVLRSEDLASKPAHDAAFLAGLRDRLAAEPAILAPAPVAAKASRQSWLLPAAVAAGFVVVAGVLVVARMGLPSDAAGSALAAASSPALTLVGNGGLPAAPAGRVGEGQVIRNARLDEYLRAHQSARGGIPVAGSGGELRRVDAIGTVVPAGTGR